ncbi:uncharacterized protein DNG_06905 [Cephalotrichum gorgonifer]|uniref:Uncharacterized protein n=1 Tax=Cephalotrichum gorgonifer TaxID=2041049 RepID=A0AAE8N1I0_9PEZI|nr:uncharacterized protein DNG_06905 [Cephalotrichum gorgonifer]
MARPTSTVRPYSQVDVLAEEENMFSGLKINRGSGSSNTTKTASTDTSSRHSAVSTTPSSATPSADPNHHYKQHQQQHMNEPNRPSADIPTPATPKSSGSGFLNRAGRTFSFGTKKNPPSMPSDDAPPPVPAHGLLQRSRGLTSSTTSTATPPKLDDEEFNLGGDFGNMFKGFDKRASVATVRDDASRGMPPRSLTGNRATPSQLLPSQTAAAGRPSQPPLSPHSINSDHSNDGLLNADRPQPLPHSSSYNKRAPRPSDIIEDEDASLLKQSIAASTYLADSGAQAGRSTTAKAGDDDNMFDNGFLNSTRAAHRYVARPPSPPRNKVMTTAQFEQYKQEKGRATTQSKSKAAGAKDDDSESDEDYEDDEDEVEKSKEAAKQRRKQEANMAVYRQQMMKVTGEAANAVPRPPLATTGPAYQPAANVSDGSDEDEEIPLAILAAHGFPTKNRAPSRLSVAGSNPNLRASMLAPHPPSRSSTLPPGEQPAQGAGAGARGSHLPAFARRLPQDPFVGAGLVRNQARESMAMGGGAPAAPHGPLPPGGLVGVIASEERSRALRRGLPQADGKLIHNINGPPGAGGVDPMTGMPHPMMYGMGNLSMPQLGGMGFPQPMLTPGDQAQIQMTQQMQQFMQMQMQFMQMMTANQGQGQGAGGSRPTSFAGGPGMMGDMNGRQSFMGSEYQMDTRPMMMNDQMRTMSMVQPSSASWIQPMPGYAPSIRVQGDGYAPSIAPSERSNIGLPGRYRPVSHMPPPNPMQRSSTMTGALGNWEDVQKSGLSPSPGPPAKSGNTSDDDDEEGWAAMKAKREKKKSMWKGRKSFGQELSALIS